MDMYFVCIAAVLTIHKSWRIGSYKNIVVCYAWNSCVMHGIHVFNRNVWFLNVYIVSRGG